MERKLFLIICGQSLTFQLLNEKKNVKNGLFLVHFDTRRCYMCYNGRHGDDISE